MSKHLETRVNKLVERMGDLSNPLEAFKAKARAMPHEELRAALRDAMLANGYDPSLPRDEALTAHIAKIKAEAETKTPEEQEIARQLVAVTRQHADSIARLFPASTRSNPAGNGGS